MPRWPIWYSSDNLSCWEHILHTNIVFTLKRLICERRHAVWKNKSRHKEMTDSKSYLIWESSGILRQIDRQSCTSFLTISSKDSCCLLRREKNCSLFFSFNMESLLIWLACWPSRVFSLSIRISCISCATLNRFRHSLMRCLHSALGAPFFARKRQLSSSTRTSISKLLFSFWSCKHVLMNLSNFSSEEISDRKSLKKSKRVNIATV